jgi:hypothetical protein
VAGTGAATGRTATVAVKVENSKKYSADAGLLWFETGHGRSCAGQQDEGASGL